MGANINTFYGHIIRGDLLSAMGCLEDDPEQTERYGKYLSRFVREETEVYPVDAFLNEILAVYQQYYREIFYLRKDRNGAAEQLRDRLAACFDLSGETPGLDDLEEGLVAAAFITRGYHFQGGRTGGYYGPYVWKTTQTMTYEVELPDGMQEYTVKLLDGFISRSWVDYLSFGEIGTGGWTDGDGIINCVRSAYDLQSEDFTVSLLKHEAQHVMDLRACKEMSSEDLEYRAKLVELIYSRARNLLACFVQQAGDGEEQGSHALAAHRITEGFTGRLGLSRNALTGLDLQTVSATAMALFRESSDEIRMKYL